MSIKNILIVLSFITSFFTLTYWISVFTGIFPVTEIIPGYTNWFMSFPIADFWIAISSLLAGLFLIKGNEKATPFGIVAGSSLLFLGLYAMTYGVNTGLLFNLTLDEIIEIVIKIYSITVGTIFMVYFWKIRINRINRIK